MTGMKDSRMAVIRTIKIKELPTKVFKEKAMVELVEMKEIIGLQEAGMKVAMKAKMDMEKMQGETQEVQEMQEIQEETSETQEETQEEIQEEIVMLDVMEVVMVEEVMVEEVMVEEVMVEEVVEVVMVEEVVEVIEDSHKIMISL